MFTFNAVHCTVDGKKVLIYFNTTFKKFSFLKLSLEATVIKTLRVKMSEPIDIFHPSTVFSNTLWRGGRTYQDETVNEALSRDYSPTPSSQAYLDD